MLNRNVRKDLLLIESAEVGFVAGDIPIAKSLTNELTKPVAAKAVHLIPRLINAVTLVGAIFAGKEKIDLGPVGFLVSGCDNDTVGRRNIDKVSDFNVLAICVKADHFEPPCVLLFVARLLALSKAERATEKA